MRKENMKFLTWLLLLIFTLGVVSCSKEDAQLAQEQENIDNKLATITITAYAGENDDDTKTVIAGEDYSKVHWNANEKIAVFYNRVAHPFTSVNTAVGSVASFSGSLTNVTNPAQLAGKKVFGLYPYNSDATIDNSGVITTTLPSVQTAVDDTFADNLNISIGKSTTDATTMKFYNVCSGLCFTVSHDDIKTVCLRGANGEILAGRFKIKFDIVDGKEVPTIQTIYANFAKNIITVEAPNGGTFIPGKRYYALTIPQSLPNGLIIEGFRADGTVYTNTINKDVTLKRSVFARKTNFDSGLTAEDLYNYTLTVSQPSVFDYLGGTQTGGYKVTSFRSLKSNSTKKFPVAWKSQITTDDGTTWNDLTEENKATYSAGWFTMGAYSAAPASTSAISYDVTADIAEGTSLDIEKVHTAALKSGKHKSGINNSTKANAIDLSMYDLLGNSISQTTANCYIVNAPGWYKIPMVYGNAIKNGVTNTNAFTSNATQVSTYWGNSTEPSHRVDHVLMNFFDHEGSNITQPWVTNAHSGGAYSVSNAELVWQDAKNLVTNITVGHNGNNRDYIYFCVNQNTIHQGNAVIAAYVGETIAWSWQIWVTDQDMSSIPIKNYQNVIYNVLPVSLGWCDVGTNTCYSARSANLRVIQTIGIKEAELHVSQNGKTPILKGNQTYYQYGRKDPMLPHIQGGSHPNKPWYNKDGVMADNVTSEQILGLNEIDNRGKDISVIMNMIQKPFTIITDGISQYFNPWSANLNTTGANNDVVVKTIYDPSPIGYCIPASMAFTGFTTTGEKANRDPWEVNGVYDDLTDLWILNTNIDGGTIEISASDMAKGRGHSGEATAGGWALVGTGSTPTGGRIGNCYIFGCIRNASDIEYFFVPYRNVSAGYSNVVRPVQEK